MGKRLLFGLCLFTLTPGLAGASATWRMYSKLSSVAQDVRYVQEAIDRLLVPSGLSIDPDSVQIYETVIVGNPKNFNPVLEVILQTPTYGARTVFFDALNHGDPKTRMRGNIHLILAKADGDQALVPLNSSAMKLISPTWKKNFYLMLATDIVPDAFAIDVLVSDLKLEAVKPEFCEEVLAPSNSQPTKK